MTTIDPLRNYLRVAFDYGGDGHVTATQLAWHSLSAEDRDLVRGFRNRFDEHADKNSGLLADLTDAVYGKGTAEAKGYPRGLARKVRRVFNRLRRMQRCNGDGLLDDVSFLISEVK